MQVLLITGAITALVGMYGYGLYHTIKADRCYARIRIADKALEQANRSQHQKIKVYRLIHRAKQASYNRSTEAMVYKLMERYNAKFNSDHSYEKAYELN